MRALTLWQPWAWAVGQGIKRVENRPWAPSLSLQDELATTGFAIHAGKTWDQGSHDSLDAALNPNEPKLPERSKLVYGAIIAVTKLVGVAYTGPQLRELAGPEQLRWFFGPVGWVLTQTIPVKPIPCRGFQGLWRIDDDVLLQLRKQLDNYQANGEPDDD